MRWILTCGQVGSDVFYSIRDIKSDRKRQWASLDMRLIIWSGANILVTQEGESYDGVSKRSVIDYFRSLKCIDL